MSQEAESTKSFHEFVPVLFARNLIEAEFYQTLLAEHEIPVLIEDENTESFGLPDIGRGVPVLVPDEQLAEAEDILEQREDSDDDSSDNNDDDEDDEDDELEGLEPFGPDDDDDSYDEPDDEDDEDEDD